jgi:hypothetical protein
MSQPILVPTHLLFKIVCCVYMYCHVGTLNRRAEILTERNRLYAAAHQLPPLDPSPTQKSSEADLQ